MPRYDKELVKSAADGRWTEVLSHLARVPADCLDGGHHPCPKHCGTDAGGSDRFRALNDFEQTGAVLCGQCFSSGNGDGFAALQWLTGDDFGKVLGRVAKYLGVKPEKGRKKAEPTDELEFLKWNKTAATLWAQTKPPIELSALERVGARYAKYRKHYTVIAIPVWGPQLDADLAVGWIIYRSDGGLLPRYSKKKDTEPEWVKVLLTKGSQQGVVTCLEDWKGIGTDGGPRTWVKLEGSTDLLAALSQQWPSGYAFFTTANGAGEKPMDWIAKAMEGCLVHVCHDADMPGQQGATWVSQVGGKRRAGWCPVLAKLSKEVRNVQLPFAVEPSHGPDIRDYFKGGGSVERWLELAARSEVWKRDAVEREQSPMAEFVASFNVPDGKDIVDPEVIAMANIDFYSKVESRKLVYWRGEWYRYKGTHYEKIGTEHLRVRLREFGQEFLFEMWKIGKDDREKSRAVNRSLVDNVIDSMKVECMLSPSEELDTWIDKKHPNECVAFENKILNLTELFKDAEHRGEYLLDHSANWFSMTCLPYACDLEKRCPMWLHFLDEVLVDAEAIDALQRWFGYLLLPDTSQQKMMFIIGPTRSGKGTMMKVMINLFGRQSVASPTLSGLIDQYSLHGVFGKTIAIIPDARLSRRADREAVTEKLLSLVANDPQDIQRKYLNTLNGVEMNLRFTLFSNKLPDLDDSTAAMAGRGIYLLMPNSFYGREDLGLADRLMQELPGILNWAVVGRHKLREDSKIRQPKCSEHLVRQMRMTMAPVKQFFEECTRIHYSSSGALASDVFQKWCEWANENAFVHRMTVTDFERKAIDSNPGLRAEKIEMGGMIERKFVGMELIE